MHWTRRSVVGSLAASIACLPRRGTAAGETGAVRLEAGTAKLQLTAPPGGPTAAWGYNGQIPGPLIRVTKGAEIRAELVNKLDQPTSLCWHGVRIPNAMDGVAGLTQAPVRPGESFTYRFTPPDAGVYWYHPHVHPFSAEQIGRGLYGLLIVDEPDPPPVDHDVIVLLDDWSLDSKGQIEGNFLDREIASRDGRIGSALTVNGVVSPGAPTKVRPGARLRIRILNACSARIAVLSLTGMSVTVVAVDGQTSELFPPAAGTIPVGPGSRFEVMADVPREPGQQPTLVLRGLAGKPDIVLMRFTAEGEALPDHKPVQRLPENTLLPSRIALERSLKRDLVIGGGAMAPAAAAPSKPFAAKQRSRGDKKKTGETPTGAPQPESKWLWTIDGSGSDGLTAKPLFRVKRGNPVTLAFINRTAFVQQMHVHGHVFRVLHDLDDGWDPYWRESILIGPGKTKHVAFVADNPGKWAVESLILDRQVTGLVSWFEVT